LGQHAVVTEALDLEQLAVHGIAEIAQVREVVDGLPDVEVIGIVDGRFRAEGVFFLEVLLDVRRLVLDVEARLHAVGDHACAIAVRRRRRPPRQTQGKEESDPIGATEVEILADHRFEEVAALDGLIEDVREAHFKLTDGEAVVVASGAVGRRHRPWEAMRPAIEEGLHVGGTERIAGGL
jgi:hypothetical protein